MPDQDQESLDRAYRATIYEVGHGGERTAFTFAKPSDSSPRTIRLPFAEPWAIITAWNPMSDPRPEQENRARQDALLNDLNRAGWPHHPARGRGTGESSDWEEIGALVERIPRPDVLALAERYAQRAVVYAEYGRVGLLYPAATGGEGTERWDVLPVYAASEPKR